MAKRKLLAFAAASGRVGSVFFIGGRLMDWQMSTRGARDNLKAAEHAQCLINKYRPDVVVTQDLNSATSKGERTLVVITGIARTAANNDVLHIVVERHRSFENKYCEADMLAGRYPEIAAWKPQKRRAFDNEPRNTVLFEALALAENVVGHDAPPIVRG